MLPSMPVLFTRESQDAFGNKILSNTSAYINNNAPSVIERQDSSIHSKTNVEIKNTLRSKTQIDLVTSSNGNPKEMTLVTSYFSKVKARFAANSNQSANKFVQFQNLLKTFDPMNDTPVNLYRKIEMLFGEEHKDLVEDFLLFLTPSQAEEIGRFMDHFEMNKLVNFIDILKTTFAHRPTILRKVIKAMNSSLNCGNMEEMKFRVLPHFRSHPRLIHLFKSLFPDERPPESWYDSADTINETILTDDQGYDVWEFEEPKKGKDDTFVKGELDTVYVQGRVFLRHGKMLRAARVTFPYSKEPYRVHARRLGPAHCQPTSPPDTDDERASPRRNVAKRNTKKVTKKSKKSHSKTSCPKQLVKDVNDNNKQILESSRFTNVSDGTKRSNKLTAHGQSEKHVSKHVSENKFDVRDAKNSRQGVRDKADTIKHTDRNHTHKRDKQKERLKNTADQKKDQCTKAKQLKFEGTETKKLAPLQITMEPSSWTRDEDKTMLQILKGEAESDQIFGKIRELLPHRSLTDIKERFQHVVSLLQQMAVGEVT